MVAENEDDTFPGHADRCRSSEKGFCRSRGEKIPRKNAPGLSQLLRLCTQRHTYFDTVEVMLSHRLTPLATRHLRTMNPGFEFLKFPCNPRWPYGIRLQFPSKTVIRLIADITPKHLVRRIDIAFDWLTSSRNDAEVLGQTIQGTLTQPYRGKRLASWQDEFLYLAKRRDSRNAVLYWDRPSKLTGGPAAHLDCRLNSAAQCRKVGVDTLPALLQLDCEKVLSANFRISELRTSIVRKRISEAARKSVFGRRAKRGRRFTSYDWSVATTERRIWSNVCGVIGGPDCAPWTTPRTILKAPVQCWIDHCPRFCKDAIVSRPSYQLWTGAKHWWP